MKETIETLEPQARALLRIIAAYMILLHALREVFNVMPAPKRGPGSFMALDLLGQTGGVPIGGVHDRRRKPAPATAIRRRSPIRTGGKGTTRSARDGGASDPVRR